MCSNIEREAAVRTETIGWIIGILIAAALVWWIYRKIKRKMRQLASTPEIQVLRYVAKHLSEGDLTQPDASKPCSLAGMDRLCLPQIAKDFPEFNWSEWKAQIETELRKKLEKEYQRIKDRKHDAYSYKYHLIDLLRLSKFTFAENQAQKWENYKYTFNRRTFLLQNGLYIAIILIFVALCIICLLYTSPSPRD